MHVTLPKNQHLLFMRWLVDGNIEIPY